MNILNSKLLVPALGLEVKSERERSRDCLFMLTACMTSVLIWAYTINAYFFGADKNLFLITLIGSSIHILFSLSYYYSITSFQLSLNIFIFSGFICISAWSYYTGGFSNYLPVWYAAPPLVGGVVGGKKDLLFWGMISFLSVLLIYILFMSGVTFPSTVSVTGLNLGRAFLMFGLIILNTVFMYAYFVNRDRCDRAVVEKSEEIECLLSLVGHDISNPLTVVSLSAKQLSHLLVDYDDKKVNYLLQKVESNTEGINSILKQIRDFQSVKTGNLNLRLERVYLNEIIDYISKVFESSLREKNISLKYDYKANEDIYFMGNTTSLKYQIFGNLVSNAIKFSDSGENIFITAEDLGEEGVLVEVKDHGVGINKSSILQLLEGESIPSKLGTMGEKGSGLGMSIVRRFVEINMGSISVKSKTKLEYPDDHGTVFSLNFKKPPC